MTPMARASVLNGARHVHRWHAPYDTSSGAEARGRQELSLPRSRKRGRTNDRDRAEQNEWWLLMRQAAGERMQHQRNNNRRRREARAKREKDRSYLDSNQGPCD